MGGHRSRHPSCLPLSFLCLSLFVSLPNLGSIGCSVGSPCSVCRGTSVGAVPASVGETDRPGTLQKRRTNLKPCTSVTFTLVCHPSKSGVVWAVGCLPVIRLPWGRMSGRSGEMRQRETVTETDERDGTTRNMARACHLPLFVTSSNLGSFGFSVGLPSSIYRRVLVGSAQTELPGERRTRNLSRETDRFETKQDHVIYPLPSPL